ncbi:uncharacterized protein LOC132203941 [Neocloeon triangulifer]|uniref:uncharacterized protein LOC132203941 n=1 Tax=Neocloeon triangulifer TaxID=2078957 RepID=UPI00286F2783|nr:uncharacterized protein LOC132203941 [Neocloeon triangulifer]XP_059488097.1 uncharacterized protein LOC132203941 [Neocloeon triangulifer]
MKVYQGLGHLALVFVVILTLVPDVFGKKGPRNQHRSRPPSPNLSRNKKVKRHNLQRPVKPVYHSPPINAFSLKDLQKDEEEDFPPAPLRSPSHFSKPLVQDGSNEELYFASLKNQFAPNFGSDYFSPNPNVFKGHKPRPAPPKKGNFGLYGPDFGSITELNDDDDKFEDNQDFFANQYQKPYQTYHHPTTTVKPKLLVPTYAAVKPANIRHLGSSGYGYPSNNYQQNNDDHQDYVPKDAHYSFGYEISNPGGKYGKGPQLFGHGEQRDGDVTKGRYHVLLPDGRHQKVAYTADHSGYHAHVSYSQHGYHGR